MHGVERLFGKLMTLLTAYQYNVSYGTLLEPETNSVWQKYFGMEMHSVTQDSVE
jgi:hypothetical protein